jgi:hypothetical protein
MADAPSAVTRFGELGTVAIKLAAPTVSTRLKERKTLNVEQGEAPQCPGHGGPKDERSSEHGGEEEQSHFALLGTRLAQLSSAACRGGHGGDFY